MVSRTLRLLLKGDLRFLQRPDYGIAGVVFDDNDVRFDHSLGDNRVWVQYFDSNGKLCEEPLDRKNQITGDLEPVVIRKNHFVILTARKTDSESDSDENFQWIMNPRFMNMLKERKDLTDQKDKQIQEMELQLNGAITDSDFYKNHVETIVTDNRVMNTKTAELFRENLNLKRQNREIYAKLKELQADVVSAESAREQKLENAEKEGRAREMTRDQLTKEALEEQREMSNLYSRYDKDETQHEETKKMLADINKTIKEKAKEREKIPVTTTA